MNYKTAHQIGKGKIKPYNKMQVVGADGSDLGAVGEIRCDIEVGRHRSPARFHSM